MCQKIVRNNRNALDSATDVNMAAINTNTPASVPNFSSEDNKFPKSKRKLQKHLRSAGLAYVSRTGKLIPAKKIADELCQCPHKCDDLVPTEARHRLFQHFYGLGEADAQNQFLRQNMDLRARLNVPETSANGRPPRRITCKYLVPLLDEERSVEVCQKAFVSAFVITTKRVRLQREKLISSLGLSSYKSHNRSKDKDKKPQETNNNIITLSTLTEEMNKANNNNSKIVNNNNITINNNNNNNNNNAKKTVYYDTINNNNNAKKPVYYDTININSVTITKQPKVVANNTNKSMNQSPVQEVPLNLSANLPLNLSSNLSLILQNINGHRNVSVKREAPEVTVTAEVVGGEKSAEKSPPRSEEGPSTSTFTETKPPPRKRSKKLQFNPFMPYNLLMPDGVSIAPVVNPDFDRDLMIVNNFFHNQLWKPEYIGAHS